MNNLTATMGPGEMEPFKLKNADPGVFENFYLTYKDKVYSYLLFKTKGNTHIAEDVLSDTFHSALKSVSKLKNNKNLRAWLTRIANRRLADYFEKYYRENRIVEAMKAKMDILNHNVHEMQLLKKEKMVLFNSAINRIKPQYANIIKLKYIEKKTQKEIALLLKKHEKAVEGLLHRARAALRVEMKSMNQTPEHFSWITGIK